MSKEKMGEQLRRLRIANGHPTARNFANALGISENRYARYERGEATPKPELVRAICAQLGISPSALFDWREEHEASPGDRAARQGAAPRMSGFSEAPADRDRGAGPGAPSASPSDFAAWRLASVLARAVVHSAEEAEVAPGIAGMRVTAGLYIRLKRDPINAIAETLHALPAGSLPAPIEEALAAEIQAYLAEVCPSPTHTG